MCAVSQHIIPLLIQKINYILPNLYWNWLNLPPMVVCGMLISLANELTSATDHLQSYSLFNECNYLALNQDSIFLFL